MTFSVPFISTRQGASILLASRKKKISNCFLTAVVLLKVWKVEVWFGVTDEDLRNELSSWIKVVFT